MKNIHYFVIPLLAVGIFLTGCADKKQNEQTPPLLKVEISEEGSAECTECDNKKYNHLRSEYELFGKWMINNSQGEPLYVFEIHQKGKEFIGVRKMDGLQFERLSKDDDSYIIQDNEHGEFYLIDNEYNMKLFDQDPEWVGAGRSATKSF